MMSIVATVVVMAVLMAVIVRVMMNAPVPSKTRRLCHHHQQQSPLLRHRRLGQGRVLPEEQVLNRKSVSMQQPALAAPLAPASEEGGGEEAKEVLRGAKKPIEAAARLAGAMYTQTGLLPPMYSSRLSNIGTLAWILTHQGSSIRMLPRF